MGYTLYQFGTLVLPSYNASVDVGTGRFNAVYRALPGGGVFRPAGMQRSRRGATPVSKRAIIAADTAAAFRTAYNTLRALGGSVARLWRMWDTGDVEWCWAELGEIPATRERGHITHLPLTLQFTMISPHWYGDYHGAEWEIDLPEDMVIGDGHFLGADETVTLVGSPQAITITNGGNRDLANVELTVTAGDANITALKIGVNDCEFTFGANILATKALVIDCGGASVKNDGVDAYTSFALTANHKTDDWFVLEPGANTVTVTYTGGGVGSTFLCSFYDGWE